jgi:hypothetical protein
VSKAQTLLQPVNCSSSVDFFTTFLTIDVMANAENDTVTQDDGVLLGQSIQGSYNLLAQQLCDPLFRTDQSVELVKTENTSRAGSIDNKQPDLQSGFSVRGRCRAAQRPHPFSTI